MEKLGKETAAHRFSSLPPRGCCLHQEQFEILFCIQYLQIWGMECDRSLFSERDMYISIRIHSCAYVHTCYPLTVFKVLSQSATCSRAQGGSPGGTADV